MMARKLSVGAMIMAALAVWVAASPLARPFCHAALTSQSHADSAVRVVRAVQAPAQGNIMRCAPPCRDCAPDQRSFCCASAVLAAADIAPFALRRDRDPLWSGADHRTSQGVAPPYRPPNAPSTTREYASPVLGEKHQHSMDGDKYA